MKRLILIPFLLICSICYSDVDKLAGQDITTSTVISGVGGGSIAGQTITGGGGGGGTERLTPEENGATAEWDDGTGSSDIADHVDDAWSSRASSTENNATTNLGDVSIKTFTNPVSMGAGQTCTAIRVDYYGEDAAGTADIQVEIAFSVDNGSTWEDTFNISPDREGKDDYQAPFTGLSYTRTEMDNFQVRLTSNGTSGLVPVNDVLSAEIDYE